jgi:16S rRNA (guanine(527)-N(7))-methyltransferase RsmG
MMPTQADEFARALVLHAPQYELQLAPHVSARLTDYYKLINAWNARLHLVAPCAPDEFATRHVLESLVVLRFIRPGARFIDVGTGAGLPALPCLIARTDLHALLVESATKKAVFLREAISQLGLRERTEVRAERFERTIAPEAEFVTCRALERFTEMLLQLVAWSPPASTLLLFGGPTLQAKLEQLGLPYQAVALPASERRFLFIANKTR